MLITSPRRHAILLPRPGRTNCHWQTERSGKAALLFRTVFMWSIIAGWPDRISDMSSVATMYTVAFAARTSWVCTCIGMSYGIAGFPPYGNVCTWAHVLIHKHECRHTRLYTDLTSIHGIKWSVKTGQRGLPVFINSLNAIQMFHAFPVPTKPAHVSVKWQNIASLKWYTLTEARARVHSTSLCCTLTMV